MTVRTEKTEFNKGVEIHSSGKIRNKEYEKMINCIKIFSNGMIFITAGFLFYPTITIAKPISAETKKASYSPYADQSYPTNVYWGDTHLHTNLSVDAAREGNASLKPSMAYQFAKGREVTAHNGMKVKLQRPLDFLVIADHIEGIGNVQAIRSENAEFLASEKGQSLYKKFRKTLKSTESKKNLYDFFNQLWGVRLDTFGKAIWQDLTRLADEFNEPGKFTTFIGYEWTSGSTLHRVVMFKDSSDKVDKILPFTAIDSQNPEDLWQFLENYSQVTGGDVIAIPHNGNLSRGQMFALHTLDDQPLSIAYAKTRSRWEPLYEVTQIKGDSETHPRLSPNDEFADFGTWNSLAGRTVTQSWDEAAIQRKQSEYARSALQLGLKEQQRLGVNPFKFGLIGSTDAHTSLSTADDNNFWGKFSKDESRSQRMFDPVMEEVLLGLGWETIASGYAAVWAKENTREAIFTAMKRKEVYSTTGPRITVRFFGGWAYEADDAFKSDLARIGYNKGVPMGGDLTNAPENKSPRFLIRAVRDPDGANLDRVQVIKGWHDKNGELHEKIYNVALSDHRKSNWRGKVKPVGNTVDIPDASYINSIGDPELAVVWTDPDFDKNELAFYYVRVLEIPTPRWTAYDAKFFDIKNIPEEVPMVTQERAYTSPIWYSPTQ